MNEKMKVLIVEPWKRPYAAEIPAEDGWRIDSGSVSF